MTAIKPEPGSSLVNSWVGNADPPVCFIGVDGHLHQLVISSGAGSADVDLTALTGAQPPALQSGLTGFWTPLNDVHIFYFGVGTDNHVFELALGTGDPQWVSADLTTAVDGVVPVVSRALCSHVGTDHSQHVFFVGSGQHIQELYYQQSAVGSWTENDLTALAGAVLAHQDTALISYWGTDSSQHVIFVGEDGHLHELYIRPGAGWVDNDLTELAAAVTPAVYTALAGYWATDSSQHVLYIGSDNQLHELYIVPGIPGWHDDDLTKVAHAITPSVATAVDAYTGSDGSVHVNFFGVDGHIHELYNHPGAAGAGWVDNDLTQLANAVAPATGDPTLYGYWGADSSQHVHFIGVDRDVHELYIAPGTGWVDNNLTQLA